MSAEAKAKAKAEVAASEWEIVGKVQAHDRGPLRHVALSPDRLSYAVLIEIYGKWQIKAGPWTYETMLRCSENVVAGDQRAITWPDAQLCVSAGYIALWCEMERRRLAAPQAASPAGSGIAASGESGPPAAGMKGLGGPHPTLAPPSPPACPRAGCGE